MRLAIFDLDNTLLGGDSDHLWGEYLCQRGILDAEQYKAGNDAFYEDYLAGRLDILAYQNFSQEILAKAEPAQLAQWHAEFMRDCIEPIILAKGEALLEKRRSEGYTLLIITATNRFITGPIAKRLGVDYLIATECGMENGRYTGQVVGQPSYHAGKVVRLNEWLIQHKAASLEGSYFYSDSHNDLPLLEEVSYPVAVDPDDTLRAIAQERGWTILSLR